MMLVIQSGDDVTFYGERLDAAGSPIDISAFTVTSELRDSPGGTLLATFVVDLGYGGSHEFSMSLTDAVTGGLSESIVYMDIKFVDGSGEVSHTSRTKVKILDTITQ